MFSLADWTAGDDMSCRKAPERAGREVPREKRTKRGTARLDLSLQAVRTAKGVALEEQALISFSASWQLALLLASSLTALHQQSLRV